MADRALLSRAWISLHDLMPSTLSDARRLLEYLTDRNVGRMTLLVVPGVGWSADDRTILRRLQDEGHELAGHGWLHAVDRPPTLYHRIHGWTFSRGVAEHLSRSEEEIAELIRRCFRWFAAHDLAPPTLYVPPAWAMGSIRRERLRQLPFARYEFFTGIYDAAANRFHRMPLVGYEADTPWRRAVLRLSNAVNQRLTRPGVPCRIALHPRDLDLLLRPDLDRLFGDRGS